MNTKTLLPFSACIILSLIVFLLIKTQIIGLAFAVVFAIISISIVHLIFGGQKEIGLKINKLALKCILYSLFGLFSIIVFASSPIQTTFGTAASLFSSLSAMQISQVVGGFILLTVFPGYFIFSDQQFSKIEKIVLVLSSSYVINLTLGLALNAFAALSVANYLALVWGIALVAEILRFLRRPKLSRRDSIAVTVDVRKLVILLTVCSVLVFSVYAITLFATPTSPVLSGDVADYLSNYNSFINGMPVSSPYLWFQIFVGLGSMLTGLSPLYAFIGMQFLIVIFPLTVYIFFLKIIKNEKIALVGTVLVSVTGGLGSIGIFGLFSDYSTKSTADVLWTLHLTTQDWPWLSNHLLIVGTIDNVLILLSFTYLATMFSQLEGNLRRDTILGCVFLAACFFTHNFFGIFLVFTAIFILSLKNHKYQLKAIFAVVLTVILCLVLDGISGELFTKYVTSIVNYILLPNNAISTASFTVIGGLCTLCVTLFFAPRIIKIANVKMSNRLKDRKIPSGWLILIAVSIIVVMLAVVFTAQNLNTRIYQETVFPWYIYLLWYSPLIGFSIIAVPIVIYKQKESRIGVSLLLSLIVSAYVLVGLRSFFPSILSQVVVNRLLMFCYIPLSGLAAVTILSFARLPKVSTKLFKPIASLNTKVLATGLLLVLMVFSLLSFAYGVEFFYCERVTSPISSDQQALLQYLNSLPKDSVFLSYSTKSYRLISSMCLQKTYSFYKSGCFSLASVQTIFNSSSPQVVNQYMQALNLTHLVFTTADLSLMTPTTNSALLTMFNSSLPITFSNSYATVYAVPKSNNVVTSIQEQNLLVLK